MLKVQKLFLSFRDGELFPKVYQKIKNSLTRRIFGHYSVPIGSNYIAGKAEIYNSHREKDAYWIVWILIY